MTILLGLLVGCIMPAQAAINARLRVAVQSPWVMSTISFGVGTAGLAILALIADGGIGFDLVGVATQHPWWIWLGGAFGMVGMTSIVLLIPHLGAMLTTVSLLVGQILTAALVDHFQLFNAPHHRLTPLRVVGMVLVLVGAIATVYLGNRASLRLQRNLQRMADDDPMAGQSTRQVLLLLAGLGIGLLYAFQAAVNGTLGEVLGSPVKSALISFTVGFVGLLILLIILRPRLQLTDPTGKGNPWWIWIGGLIGAIYIYTTAALVPLLGAGATMILLQTGMLIGSLIIDSFGLFHAAKKPFVPAQLLTLVVMLSGVAVIEFVG
ncbi:DMT family transporter [Auritidibacter ignavus]|uniref:DMT family transporter n=1 Tax=Auritidibacter ignavus TaxID=678932 RepID=UPI002447C71C|nr:DMT family transporter [Auritidibacter ignavus]WGH83591.1 DMT family transporter [Auritidibacter ignavus]